MSNLSSIFVNFLKKKYFESFYYTLFLILISGCVSLRPSTYRTIANNKICTYNIVEKSLQIKDNKYFLNFTAHRSERELKLFNEIIKDPSSLNSELLPKLSQYIERLDNLFKFNKQLSDSKKIENLTLSGLIDWIGVEYSEDEVKSKDDSNLNKLKRFSIIQSALENAGAQDSLKDKALLLFAGSPGYYAWLSKETVRKTLTLVPLDSNELKKKGLNLLENLTFYKELIYMGVEGTQPSILRNVDKAMNALKAYSYPNPAITDKKIGEIVSKIDDKEVRDFTIKIFKEERYFNENQRDRDSFVVDKILMTKGSGWISFGSMHRDIVNKLDQKCNELQ